MTVELARTILDARALSRRWRGAGQRVGLVPTMGALHEGHLSLVRLARRAADRVMVTIFVNPTQFGPREDFSKYPRDLPRDLRLCEVAGADAVFAPEAGEMYPLGGCTSISIGGPLTEGLCGASRPGHFRAVATVVAKLFNICEPDAAVFGRKDAQQVAVIRRMARDLDFPVEIVEAPIVREPDGLAMSSRNRYLSPGERLQATVLSRALGEAERLFGDGERDGHKLKEGARRVLAEAPLARVDYIEVVDASTLTPVETVRAPALLALAAFVGGTRLIDNTVLRPFENRAGDAQPAEEPPCS